MHFAATVHRDERITHARVRLRWSEVPGSREAVFRHLVDEFLEQHAAISNARARSDCGIERFWIARVVYRHHALHAGGSGGDAREHGRSQSDGRYQHRNPDNSERTGEGTHTNLLRKVSPRRVTDGCEHYASPGASRQAFFATFTP